MLWIPYLFCGLLGSVIGSFLNVVIYRLHTGKSLGGRSHCMSCGETLLWYELLPVVSYLFLRGRCNVCSSHIPSRYLAVELCTAALFMLAWYTHAFDFVPFVLTLILFSFFVVILVYDIRHTIIPDEMTMGIAVIATLMLVWQYWLTHDTIAILWHLVAGVATAFFFWVLWYYSKGRWLGLGDAKLALPLGVLLGGSAAFSMVVFAFWIGAAIAIILLTFQRLAEKGKTHLHFAGRPLTMKSEVPFAPFLIAGFLIVYSFHADVFFIIERALSLFF